MAENNLQFDDQLPEDAESNSGFSLLNKPARLDPSGLSVLSIIKPDRVGSEAEDFIGPLQEERGSALEREIADLYAPTSAREAISDLRAKLDAKSRDRGPLDGIYEDGMIQFYETENGMHKFGLEVGAPSTTLDADLFESDALQKSHPRGDNSLDAKMGFSFKLKIDLP